MAHFSTKSIRNINASKIVFFLCCHSVRISRDAHRAQSKDSKGESSGATKGGLERAQLPLKKCLPLNKKNAPQSLLDSLILQNPKLLLAVFMTKWNSKNICLNNIRNIGKASIC